MGGLPYGLASKRAAENWKAIETCHANPTTACLNQIKKDYGNVRYDDLKDAVRSNQDVGKLLASLEAQNRTIFACDATPKQCLERAELQKVGHTAPYMVLGGTGAVVNGVRVQTAGQSSGKGSSFRGGSKKSRDNWYGYNDKSFQRWWHREGKEDFGGRDIDNAAEAKQAFEIWKNLGKPNVK